MIHNFATFTALLKALQLTPGFSKPAPGSSYSFVNHSTPLLVEPASTPPAIVSTSLPVGHTLLDSRSAQGGSCYVQPYVASSIAVVFPPFDRDQATIMRYRQQQSVNMGSWFVNENWMTPSFFKCASGNRMSELDLASGWDSIDSARWALEQHWDTFINQSDFEYLASIGINTVRLPIGYWNLGPSFCQDTPFEAYSDVYRNSWSRIMRAINMAANVGISVLIDLHGAVGSQNGQPHSGISDGTTNLFKDPLNVEKTLKVLTYLMQQLVSVTNIAGIQVLNEPENVPELTDFYCKAIATMRQASPAAAQFPLYVHNGFDLPRFTDFIANRTDFVVQDHHSYFVFTSSDDAEPASQHTVDIRGAVSDTLGKASKQQHRNLVVDEWSCAITPKSLANEPDQLQARKDFCTGQLDVYTNTAAGWGFWSYTKEECDLGWCFKAAVGKTLPSTFFSYPHEQLDDRQFQGLLDTIAGFTPPSSSDVLAKFPQDAAASSLLGRRPDSSPSEGVPQMRDSYHRFEAVHFRRPRQNPLVQRDLTTTQWSVLQGYNEGFAAGKMFAVEGKMSRLGFIGQFINDIIGPSVIAPGTETDYHKAFVQGLGDVENLIKSASALHP